MFRTSVSHRKCTVSKSHFKLIVILLMFCEYIYLSLTVLRPKMTLHAGQEIRDRNKYLGKCVARILCEGIIYLYGTRWTKRVPNVEQLGYGVSQNENTVTQICVQDTWVNKKL